jgi:ABC-type lipoprotein export system ATPase subunit
MIKAQLLSLQFVGGTEIPMKKNSVVVIVGPNNSGKSSVLSAIRSHLIGDGVNPSALTSVSLHKTSTLEELETSLADLKNIHGGYDIPGFGFHSSHLPGWLLPSSPVVGHYFASKLICELTTRSRLADCDPQQSGDIRDTRNLTHPFQKMYRDEDLERRVSMIIRKAFKRDLVVHRGAGNIIPVYIGTRPKLEEGEDRVALSYLERVEALDKIELQGDGIRSFASIVGRVITESRPIQLIDEPEAFLPPPQARLVARSILNESTERQTVIATHSSDVLRGLLSDDTTRLSVVRLMRSSVGAQAHHLEASQVADLWRDPILRFSNVLDGLFHDGVILTEADADCRFYEGLSFACISDDERPDIHYSYTGGKDRLPVVIRALNALKVPVATLTDFDVLNNDQPLKRIIEAHGGVWIHFEEDWIIVKKAVEENKMFTDGDAFRKAVGDHLKSYASGTVVPKATLKAIEKLTKSASAWGFAKSSGLAAIPHGDPTVAANRLLKKLREIGIFVAPNGEMEGFCRTIGGHGPRWVEAVVAQKDLVSDVELEPARSYVKDINSYLRGRS